MVMRNLVYTNTDQVVYIVIHHPDMLIVSDNLGSGLDVTECMVPSGMIRTSDGPTSFVCPLIFHVQVP